MRNKLIQQIQSIDPSVFDETALKVFRYQAKHNDVYAKFLDLLSIRIDQVNTVEAIPFLPISLFKNEIIKTGLWEPEVIFTSSGTTGNQTSSHHIRSLAWYRDQSLKGFEQRYGPVQNYCILALLPSYLERKGSSLVYMVDQFISLSNYKQSGYFLYDLDRLIEVLLDCKSRQIRTLLIGVSFALLDFAEKNAIDLSDTIIMETGGMKGRRQEITREELHQILSKAFQVDYIHSEYGMTELLSQAYSKGNGLFNPMHTMKVFCRELTDPLTLQKPGKSGLINIIDLANLDSCSFIATDDLGIVHPDGSFEVLGRLDHSDIRGCNLLLSEIDL